MPCTSCRSHTSNDHSVLTSSSFLSFLSQIQADTIPLKIPLTASARPVLFPYLLCHLMIIALAAVTTAISILLPRTLVFKFRTNYSSFFSHSSSSFCTIVCSSTIEDCFALVIFKSETVWSKPTIVPLCLDILLCRPVIIVFWSVIVLCRPVIVAFCSAIVPCKSAIMPFCSAIVLCKSPIVVCNPSIPYFSMQWHAHNYGDLDSTPLDPGTAFGFVHLCWIGRYFWKLPVNIRLWLPSS